MTENQRKVYEILESNGGWMSVRDIADKGSFEKHAPVICCLIGFVKHGYVEKKSQDLLNGNTMGFYRLVEKYEPKKLWFVEMVNNFGYTIKMRSFSSKEEALKYIDLRKLDEEFSFIKSTYRLYEAQEVGEY